MTRQIRLLIIDDDPVDRKVICESIMQSGMDAVCDGAAGAADAERMIAASGYDCLLLDHELGAGLGLARSLRAAGNPTPILYLAEHQTDDVERAAVDAGITDFLSKGGLSPARLATRIRFAIRVGRAEAAAARALADATLAARMRDDVLAVVSHDLRSPLHAIGLASEALRDQLAPEGKRYLGAIDRASARIERLIVDLLDATTIENGGLTISARPVDAIVVVRQAAADHELLAKDTGAKIAVHAPPEIILVSADRDRLIQVMSNLIGNALKHARGTPIDITVTRREREAAISVRDHGPGIPPAELPHVFDRYWRGRTKKAGAGLGLAIVKGIVTAHGGRLDATSTPGEGADFTFTLPLA